MDLKNWILNLIKEFRVEYQNLNTQEQKEAINHFNNFQPPCQINVLSIKKKLWYNQQHTNYLQYLFISNDPKRDDLDVNVYGPFFYIKDYNQILKILSDLNKKNLMQDILLNIDSIYPYNFVKSKTNNKLTLWRWIGRQPLQTAEFKISREILLNSFNRLFIIPERINRTIEQIYTPHTPPDYSSRKPPASVRRVLRREVGFGCPAPSDEDSNVQCGSPYLKWHHFDPPWRENQHFNPEGMIALCNKHADQADGGAYTKEQLRNFKRSKSIFGDENIQGRFNWLRNKILFIGGGIHIEPQKILVIKGRPIIWFNRDKNGCFLLNIDMWSFTGVKRIKIEDNYWIQEGKPHDLQCPPSGKYLRVEYYNGDFLEIEFKDVDTYEKLIEIFPMISDREEYLSDFEYPITTLTLKYKNGGGYWEIHPEYLKIRSNIWTNLFSRNNEVAVNIN